MTSDEIVKALRCGEDANGTPRTEPSDGELVCYDTLKLAAADLIERLEKEKAALLGSIRGGCVSCKHWVEGECGCTVAEARARADEDYKCKDCNFGKNWEWKGLEDSE